MIEGQAIDAWAEAIGLERLLVDHRQQVHDAARSALSLARTLEAIDLPVLGPWPPFAP